MISLVQLEIQFILWLSITTTQVINIDQAIYYDFKPFIYEESNGIVKGMIPEYFIAAKKYCPGSQRETQYTLKLRSELELQTLFNSNTTYRLSGLLVNVTKAKARWLPLLSDLKLNSKVFRQTVSRLLFSTPTISVVGRQSEISFINVLSIGIVNCRHVAVMAVFLSLFFAFVIWLAEMFANPQINTSFVFGASTGIWWSVVTMTALGYGDYTPKSLIGRCIGVVSILIGLLMTSFMTAIILRTFTTNNIDIRNSQVASLISSFEGAKVKENYDCTIKGYPTYAEVLNAVRMKQAKYGVINTDVAGYMQKEIRDLELAIVDLLPVQSDIWEEIYMGAAVQAQNVTDCMQLHSTSIEKEAINKYRRVIMLDTIYYADMIEFVKEEYILYPCIGIAGIFVFGIIFELAYRIRQWKLKKAATPDAERGHESTANGHANGSVKPDARIPSGKMDGDMLKLSRDIAYIKDNMVKLSAMSFYKEKCPACSWQT